MDIQRKDKFCIIPFILLNTRADGRVKTCSQVRRFIGIPQKGIRDDLLGLKPLKRKLFNLKEYSVADIWNSEFMRDFRMKKINNEYLDCCETCYYEDRLGITSKRKSFNDKFYKKYNYIIKEAKKNNGRISSMPIWWELRLSSLCNLACRICIPQSSSRMREEFTRNYNKLSSYARKMCDGANKLMKDGYLGDSKFFINQLWKNIKDIKYIELHGGEPTIDKNLWLLLERLVSTGHAKRIYLHMHTNIIDFKQKHIDILNKFCSGTIGISIDAYQEENFYCRYPTDWDKVVNNLKLIKGLGRQWQKKIKSAIYVYQCCTMDKLLWFLDKYIKKYKLDLYWEPCAVKTPKLMKVEHVPMKLRQKAVKKLNQFIRTSYMCNEHKYRDRNTKGVRVIIKYLLSNDKVAPKYLEELIEYTACLDKVRKQNVLEVFPHLAVIFGKR